MLPRGYDRPIHYTTLLLAFFGLIMMGSATTGDAAAYGTSYTINSMIKHGVFAFAGIVAMIIMSRIFLVKMAGVWARIAYLMAVIGIFITFVLPSRYGHQAWIPLPFDLGTIQPSEFAKLSVILMMANIVEEIRRYNNPQTRNIYAFWRPLGYSAFVVFIVYLQGDAGSAGIIAFLGIACYMSASNPLLRIYKRRLVLGILIAATFIVLVTLSGSQLFLKPYQIQRIAAVMDPLADQTDTTLQLANGLQAIASGGLFGKGFGNSTFKYGYVPLAASDFIFAIIIEELGIFGIIIIFGSYFLIINRLMHYAIAMETEKEKIILFGSATYFLVHLLINVGGVTGLIPMTGITLTFISSGGSSIIAAFLIIGVCQSVIANYNRNIRNKK